MNSTFIRCSAFEPPNLLLGDIQLEDIDGDPYSPIPIAAPMPTPPSFEDFVGEDLLAPTPLAPWHRPTPPTSPKTTEDQGEQEPLPAKPKRPLTAYNLFFHNERIALIESRSTKNKRGKKVKGKVAFAEMARIISARWRNATDAVRAPFLFQANIDKLRYRREKQIYKQAMQQHDRQQAQDKKATEEASTSQQDTYYMAQLNQNLDEETKSMIIRFFG